jgi:hypothetical protein
MATGDQNDVFARIKETLPAWYGNSGTPNLDALTQGYAWAGSFLYGSYSYAKLQTRIKTATDDFLDLIANDFFGTGIFPRQQGESDTSYRNRILVSLIRERATRHGIIQVLIDLTGRTPKVFEPARPADTGGYATGGVGYSAGGGYGSLLMPYQAFVTAYRPLSTGIPYVAGYGVSTGAYSTASRADYASISSIINQVTDAQIYAAIDSVKAAGTTLWTQIQS